MNKRLLKRILTDLAGIACIVAIPFVGPLPGPGGIPLLILGLSLLAKNNSWANRLLEYVKNSGDKLGKIIFPEKPAIQLAWDGVAALLIVIGIYCGIYLNGWLRTFLAITPVALGMSIVLFNRSRIDMLTRNIKKK